MEVSHILLTIIHQTLKTDGESYYQLSAKHLINNKIQLLRKKHFQISRKFIKQNLKSLTCNKIMLILFRFFLDYLMKKIRFILEDVLKLSKLSYNIIMQNIKSIFKTFKLNQIKNLISLFGRHFSFLY